jgi:flagellar biosynthesis protein FlhG
MIESTLQNELRVTLPGDVSAALPNDLRAERAQAHTRRAPIVLISGGKGGVGKTLLTANLGIELARRGQRVLLVDLDLGLANLDVVLRLPHARNVEDALRGRAALADCVVDGPCGMRVLQASSGSVDMGALDAQQRTRLVRGLRDLARDYDIVLCDGAAGIGPDVLAFCAAVDHVLVVTTPEPAALTDAYGLIKALHSFGEQVEHEVPTPELVINQVAGLDEAERIAAKLRAVCERFLARSPRSAGWMPTSRTIARSVRTRKPFALACASDELDGGLATRCLKRLAARLERLCVGSRARPQAQGIHEHDR